MSMARTCGLAAAALGALALTGRQAVAATPAFDAATLQAVKFSIRILDHTDSGSVPDVGNSINVDGVVVGQGSQFFGGTGVRWSPSGQMQGLTNIPGSPGTNPYAINDAGYIVGHSVNLASVIWHPDGSIHALPAPDPGDSRFVAGSVGSGYAINDAGMIAGTQAYSGRFFSGQQLPTVWEPSGPNGAYAGRRLDTGLTPSGSPYAGGANDVNATGSVAGNIAAGATINHETAVVWSALGVRSYLPDPTLPAPAQLLSTSAISIADDGTVAGTIVYRPSPLADYIARAGVWEPGPDGTYAPRVLASPDGSGGGTIFAWDMTSDGDVVVGTGWTGPANTGETSGLLWTSDGTALALTALLQDPAWQVSAALSVVADGDRLMVAAMVRPVGGGSSSAVPAVLTVVVPEPSGIASLSATIVTTTLLGRRRRQRV